MQVPQPVVPQPVFRVSSPPVFVSAAAIIIAEGEAIVEPRIRRPEPPSSDPAHRLAWDAPEPLGAAPLAAAGRHLWMVSLVAGGIVAGSAIALDLLPPLYRATALVQYAPDDGAFPADRKPPGGPLPAVDGEIAVLRSQDMLERASVALAAAGRSTPQGARDAAASAVERVGRLVAGLSARLPFVGSRREAAPDFGWRALIPSARADPAPGAPAAAPLPPVGPPPQRFGPSGGTAASAVTTSDTAEPVATAATRFANALSVSRIGLSTTIAIEVTAADPNAAAAAANTLAQVYIARQEAGARAAADAAVAALAVRLDEIAADLRTAEAEVDGYALARSAMAADEAAAREIRALQRRFRQLGDAQMRANAELRAIEESVTGDDALVDAVRAAERRRIAAPDGSADIARPDSALLAAADARRGALGAAVTARAAEIDALQRRLDALLSAASLPNAVSVELFRRQQRVQSLRTLYQTYLDRHQRLARLAAAVVPDSRMVAPARPPTEVAFPRKMPIIAGLGVFGLAVAVGLACWQERRRVRLASDERLRAFGGPRCSRRCPTCGAGRAIADRRTRSSAGRCRPSARRCAGCASRSRSRRGAATAASSWSSPRRSRARARRRSPSPSPARPPSPDSAASSSTAILGGRACTGGSADRSPRASPPSSGAKTRSSAISFRPTPAPAPISSSARTAARRRRSAGSPRPVSPNSSRRRGALTRS
ncbi:hypothetical protein [Segnochrobactrum spirostomi]|uniref:Polysaccharide chain length determinant N-terminal domain-containing protein n=1 Tax=Segnochrobactrum spirostomi TaxID=2608987 RepID=A0A6A7Y405_9HYPH|nr:hypothetical protein [Segnochrobactrum spirostomi]MQT13455.1 hypothetical protein [Segnochrobactrum spirostomi]